MCKGSATEGRSLETIKPYKRWRNTVITMVLIALLIIIGAMLWPVR